MSVMQTLQGKRVVVMGLGRFGGGVGVARYCVRHGAKVLVTDLAEAANLGPSLAELEGLNLRDANRLIPAAFSHEQGIPT